MSLTDVLLIIIIIMTDTCSSVQYVSNKVKHCIIFIFIFFYLFSQFTLNQWHFCVSFIFTVNSISFICISDVIKCSVSASLISDYKLWSNWLCFCSSVKDCIYSFNSFINVIKQLILWFLIYCANFHLCVTSDVCNAVSLSSLRRKFLNWAHVIY